MNWKQLLVGAAAATLLAACSSTKPPVTTGSDASAGSAMVQADTSSATQTRVDPLNNPNSVLAQRSVYFDFNSSVIKDEYRPLISAHANYLMQHADRSVVVQGNTDPRGGREYNLALGQRRAESVVKAMEVLGVPVRQLQAVSFGMEKATGNAEGAYAKDRRDDIVYNVK